MKNLQNIILIMNTLGKKEQEQLVEYKQISTQNKATARKIARKLFEQLSCVEQMQILYFMSDKESLESIKGITARVALAQNLILEDCSEEDFVDLEEERSLDYEEAFSEDDFEEADLEEGYTLQDMERDREEMREAAMIEAAELGDID